MSLRPALRRCPVVGKAGFLREPLSAGELYFRKMRLTRARRYACALSRTVQSMVTFALAAATNSRAIVRKASRRTFRLHFVGLNARLVATHARRVHRTALGTGKEKRARANACAHCRSGPCGRPRAALSRAYGED